MDYEKKYKDALERARKLKENPKAIFFEEENIHVSDYIFPELKESRDERIKEDIIWCFKHSGIKPDRPINPHVRTTMKDALTWLEKQGEQKTADKVELLFHVGDWVVNKYGDSWHIDSFDNENYRVSDGKGNYDYFPILKQDEMHRWDITNAKPGDVLVDVYGNIGIFEERYGINWHTYCYLGNKGRFISVGGSHGSISHPATKEQRDTLMRAMANAGYTFDFEKKKLKEIEHISAWSEEDERIYKSITYSFEHNYPLNSEQQNLIKSLKDRVTL